MNLAEIRKKAQKEREGTPAPTAPFRPSPPLAEPEALPPGEDPAAGCLPALRLENRATVGAPENRGEEFDPLAVILAGRDVAPPPGALQLDPQADMVAEAAPTAKYLCFRVATEVYGVDLMEAKEIIKPRPITEVPHAPPFVPGIISLRGVIIPVFDMRVRLGFAVPPPSGRERIITVKRREGVCGLLVDEVFQVVGLEGMAVERPPAPLDGAAREFVGGIGRHGEKIFIILDLEKALDETLV